MLVALVWAWLTLIKEQKNDVVLLDMNSRAVKNAQAFDMLVLHGDMLDRQALIEAGIERDVFIAATDKDVQRARMRFGKALHEHRGGNVRTC